VIEGLLFIFIKVKLFFFQFNAAFSVKTGSIASKMLNYHFEYACFLVDDYVKIFYSMPSLISSSVTDNNKDWAHYCLHQLNHCCEVESCANYNFEPSLNQSCINPHLHFSYFYI